MLEFMKNHPVATSIIAVLVFAFVALVVWVLWSNKAPQLNKIRIKSNTKGLKIAHVSDFHNAKLQDNNTELVELIKSAEPDIIAITGDLVDSRHTNVQVSIDFVSRLAQIAPCYYVAGNHESRIEKEYNELKEALISFGVIILHDEKVTYEKDGEVFTIIGIEDPMFVLEKDSVENACAVIDAKLSKLSENNEGYTILLSHRPEAFEVYADAGVNLALTGHAHGGQAQIPFIGGLIAPNQGFFPKYSEGVHTRDNTSMVISRGVGNSLCPLRFNNRPEIILIEI